MPELPEVETVRRGLDKLICGRQIIKVTVFSEKSLQVSDEERRSIIEGARVNGVRRRAKMLIIDLDNAYSLLIHLKMTGQLVYRGEEEFAGGHPNESFLNCLPDRSTRVEFDLSGGAKLFFNDQRKFGWIKLTKTAEIKDFPFVKKLGPEPLEGDPSAEFLARIRRHQHTSIKSAILNQEVLAGVGNIYADEALYLSRLHPATHVDELADAEIIEVLHSIQRVMTESINAGGSTMKNYVKADGTRGDYLDAFAKVFNRTDKPCERCGAEIIKIRVAGRGTHICPNCQQIHQ